MLSYADLGWADALTGLDPSIYRRGYMGPPPEGGLPSGVEEINRFNLGTDTFNEITVNGVLDRASDLVSFWRQLYALCAHGAMVNVFGAYYTHVLAHADPTRVRGISERTFAYADALSRKHIQHTDPLDDGVAIQAMEGIDFEVKSILHIQEEEWDGRADAVRQWHTGHSWNVIRALRAKLIAHKPVRTA